MSALGYVITFLPPLISITYRKFIEPISKFPEQQNNSRNLHKP
jgi:hypothetical protein